MLPPDKFTAVVTQDGAIIYTRESREEIIDRIDASTVNAFLEFKHLDGTTHSVRGRSIEHVFHSTPTSRKKAFELHWSQHVERAELQQEAAQEHQKSISEAANKHGMKPRADATIPFPGGETEN